MKYLLSTISVLCFVALAASQQCPNGPYSLQVNGASLTNVLNPVGIMDSALPITYYFNLPPPAERPPGSTFLLNFAVKIQFVGDFCYIVSLGYDSWSDCTGVSFGGNINETWAVTLRDEDDTLGVVSVWCGKKCAGPITYVVSASVRVRKLALTLVFGNASFLLTGHDFPSFRLQC